jgi:SNF2 family DNA or RNA helicase
MTNWGNSFHQLKEGRNIIVAGPLAVVIAWEEAINLLQTDWFKPWKHQEHIASFIHNNQGALILAEMATGKTVATLLGLKLGNRDIELIDLTTGTVKQRAERLREVVASKTTSDKVFYINHESVWRPDMLKALREINLYAFVVDECHRIKTPSSKISNLCKKVIDWWPRAKRVGLTGTPCPKDPRDIYAQFRFVDPTLLGTNFRRFVDTIAVMHPKFHSKVESWKDDGMKVLTQIVSQNSVQLRADDCVSLPEEIHRVVPVSLSKETRAFYKELEDEMIVKIGTGEVRAENALSKTLRLRQAVNGKMTVEHEDGSTTITDINGVPEKRRALEEIFDGIATDEPVVVFAEFTSDLQEIRAAAEATGREYRELSGQHKQHGDWDQGILGVQIRAGGTGVNLSAARICIFYSNSWSLADYKQAIARIRRTTQKSNKCFYAHLVATNSVDQIVRRSLESKQKVVDRVVDGLRKNLKATA